MSQRAIFNNKHGQLAVFCPGCGCMHSVNVEQKPGRPMWTWNGDLEKVTLAPSIKRFRPATEYSKQKTICHSFVRGGVWEFLNDCAHSLAGKKVDIPLIEDLSKEDLCYYKEEDGWELPDSIKKRRQENG